MTVMAQARSCPDRTWSDPIWRGEDRALTVEDLERTPDDGNRYELVDGVLVVTPAPDITHNLVATRLSVLLALRCPPGLRTITVVGLYIARDHHRIPDIAVVRTDQMRAGMKYPDTPPALAVEVSSRSTYKQDRTSKMAEYAAFGIESYWLVTPDPELPTLTAYHLRAGRYAEEVTVSGDDLFRTSLPFPFSVAPALLVADDQRWTAALPGPAG